MMFLQLSSQTNHFWAIWEKPISFYSLRPPLVGFEHFPTEALTSRDTTCVNLHSPKEELILCSSYQDITFPEVINNIDKCVEHSKSVNKDIIIGTDSNAHSELWMSESANLRGKFFEDFITSNDFATQKTNIPMTVLQVSL